METKKDKPWKDKLTVACVNFSPVLENKDANLEKMQQFIAEASGNGTVAKTLRADSPQ